MNSRILTLALAFASLFTVCAQKESETTVLTIDGKPVYMSEFEYLYNKNRNQQSVNQTPEEYADMFVLYKLKVADALKAGIDTTAAFRNEFEGYRRDLAAPYLVDNSVNDILVKEAYERMKENVNVSHIMLPAPQTVAQRNEFYARLDSMRAEILAGRADFDSLAVKYSVDPTAARKGSGNMGWIEANGALPYRFEKAAFELKEGEISPIVDSGYGLHLIKVNARRQSPGTVLVEHILKLTQGSTPQEAAAQKQAIDSIYNVLINGADFADVARRESQDPGSAANGGRLDWFGIGRMVPEFEQTAFALANGEISKPFETAYGYHIIHRIDHRGVPSLEESRNAIMSMFANDERSTAPSKAKLDQLRKKYDSKINESVVNDVMSRIKANGGYDSLMMVRLMADSREICNVPDGSITVGNVFEKLPVRRMVPTEIVEPALRSSAESLQNTALVNRAMKDLENEDPEYRNLLNEYRDGMLLFEISNRNVWERATADKDGLEKFFNKNRKAYKWDQPHFKGYIVFATNDSISKAARNYLDENKVPADSLVLSLRGKFGKNIKVEKAIAGKGANEIVDAVAFGGQKPEPKSRWVFYFPYAYKIIEQPEEAADVRGQVTADYQSLLEKEWIKDLRGSHKIKINKKVLKNVK